MEKPLAIDLFCGLGGWTEGLLREGYDVIGFDIERHQYGDEKYPAQLVIQDVRTLHGSQFRDAALIVASPPCQEFSYMAMPWSRAKAKRLALLNDAEARRRLTELFDACFRIQREAFEAAGHHIPMVVENVRGANEWVGRSRWNFGSFHLWGDVPALMPMTSAIKNNGGSWFAIANNTVSGHSKNPVNGVKVGNGIDFRKGNSFNYENEKRCREGLKLKDSDGYKRSHPKAFGWNCPRTTSKSPLRRYASAQVAKIPLPLSRHIAKVYKP